MKKLERKEMQNVQGGVICLLVGIGIGLLTGPWGGMAAGMTCNLLLIPKKAY